MKLKTALIFLLFVLTGPLARAQGWYDDNPVIAVNHSAGPVLNLRIANLYAARPYQTKVYFNCINFAVRQDYTDPSRYIVSLNPLLWPVEWGIVHFPYLSGKEWWQITALFPMVADDIANFKFRAGYFYFALDTDLYLYKKKLLYSSEIKLGAMYEKRIGSINLTYGWEYPHRNFMPPWEKQNGKLTLGLSYNIDNGPLGEYLMYRRPHPNPQARQEEIK